MRSNGFTRVELLCLAGIIAVLGVVLFPLFSRAREGRNVDLCANNLLQLARAMLAYAQDYDNRLPTYCDGWQSKYAVAGLNKGRSFSGHCWWQFIVPYLHKPIAEVRFCPSTVALEKFGEEGGNRDTSYGFNCEPVFQLEVEGANRTIVCEDNALARSDQGSAGDRPPAAGMRDLAYVPFSLALSQIGEPAEHVLLCDTNDYGYRPTALPNNRGVNSDNFARLPGHCTCTNQCDRDDDYRGPGSTGMHFRSGSVSRYRHGGGPNVAFADGHVQWFKYRDIVSKTAWWRL